MVQKLIRITIVLTTLSYSSCQYDVEEELYPDMGCQSLDMSYMNDIIPILEGNCYVCHDAANNFGNVTLDNYDGLFFYVDIGKITGVINHNPGFPQMPQNAPKLLDCEIEKIESWIADGAPNN